MINLSGFTGTEQYHKVDIFSGKVVTDGIIEMTEKCQASWLATDILIFQKHLKELQGHGLISWHLIKTGEDSAELKAFDRNNNILHSHTYSFTDFPFSKIESNLSDAEKFVLFYDNNVLYLPSEH